MTESMIKDKMGPDYNYYGISYIEMEYEDNEVEYLENLLRPVIFK